jgi:nicotinamidase-related amidase
VGGMVISQQINAEFIGTRFEEVLQESEIRILVICRLTTDHCVSTTVRIAANLGVTDRVDEGTGTQETSRVIIEGNATATFGKSGWDAETAHGVNIAILKHEFFETMSTEEALRVVR